MDVLDISGSLGPLVGFLRRSLGHSRLDVFAPRSVSFVYVGSSCTISSGAFLHLCCVFAQKICMQGVVHPHADNFAHNLARPEFNGRSEGACPFVPAAMSRSD